MVVLQSSSANCRHCTKLFLAVPVFVYLSRRTSGSGSPPSRRSGIVASLRGLRSVIRKPRPRPSNQCPSDCLCIGKCLLPDATKMAQLSDNSLYMDIIQVFHSEEQKQVEIIMKLNGRTRYVQRPRTEPLSKSLERIKINVKNANTKLAKKANKKLKGKIKDIAMEDEPTVALYDRKGEKIDGDVEIIDGWESAKLLKICDLSYRVVCNLPVVESVKLVRMPLVGIPIYPQLQLKMAAVEYSRFEWYRRLYPANEQDETGMDTDAGEDNTNEVQSGKHKMDSSDAESVDLDTINSVEGWELVGKNRTYTATVEDIDYAIRLAVFPGSEKYAHDMKEDFHMLPVYATTDSTVIKGPEELLFKERAKHTTKKCGKGSFRFVCYNILAGAYSSSSYAHDFLFPYCPSEALDIDYRKQLVVRELIEYNADIMCLQEVDRSVFESYQMPAMSLQGYAGAFAAKDGIKEGVALFYRREKFRLLMVDNIILRKVFKEERNQDLFNKIMENDEFRKQIVSKPTCLLVGLLQCIGDPTKHILVGNSHLYWHPSGSNIRLIQIELILREIRRLYAKYTEEDPSSQFTCVVTGDLNSNPYSAAVQLITDGEVKEDHVDWFSMGKAEFIPGFHLTNPKKFTSACGFPCYTTYVARFYNCLDYIFIEDDHLRVKKVIPQPSHKDVVRNSALPSRYAPSDHIAQVVDLAWI